MKKLMPLAILGALVAVLVLTNPDKAAFAKWADSKPASLEAFGTAVAARFAERTNLVVCSLYTVKPDGKNVDAMWLGIGTAFFKVK